MSDAAGPVSPSPAALRLARSLIDTGDALLRRALWLRRRLVRRVAAFKRDAGLAAIDPEREQAMARNAQADAARLQLPERTALALLQLCLDDARDLQHTQAIDGSARAAQEDYPMPTEDTHHWLGRLPPPQRWRPLLTRLPSGWTQQALQAALGGGVGRALGGLDLSALYGRVLAIEATDLGLRWVVQVEPDHIHSLHRDRPAEASVRGSATDLLLLASRLEDADTLFFQRRLQLTGDVELGLTARNLLDRLPWEQLPLPARILLQRAARLAERARRAHRLRHADTLPHHPRNP